MRSVFFNEKLGVNLKYLAAGAIFFRGEDNVFRGNMVFFDENVHLKQTLKRIFYE